MRNVCLCLRKTTLDVVFPTIACSVFVFQKDCSAILSGDVECSSSADYVRMTVTPFEDTFPLRVTLTYEELMDVLPSSVTLKALVSGMFMPHLSIH